MQEAPRAGALRAGDWAGGWVEGWEGQGVEGFGFTRGRWVEREPCGRQRSSEIQMSRDERRHSARPPTIRGRRGAGHQGVRHKTPDTVTPALHPLLPRPSPSRAPVTRIAARYALAPRSHAPPPGRRGPARQRQRHNRARKELSPPPQAPLSNAAPVCQACGTLPGAFPRCTLGPLPPDPTRPLPPRANSAHLGGEEGGGAGGEAAHVASGFVLSRHSPGVGEGAHLQ